MDSGSSSKIVDFGTRKRVCSFLLNECVYFRHKPIETQKNNNTQTGTLLINGNVENIKILNKELVKQDGPAQEK